MVFQSYALYPHMDVFNNLAFGLRRRSVPAAEIERRVRRSGRQARPRAVCSGASRTRCQAGSGNVSRWAAPSCANPRCSCSTSRCRIWMPRCGCRRAPRSSALQQQIGIDDNLCHARSGRGDDHGPSHLHHGPGRGRADRRAARGLSQPGQYLCRKVSRQSADEPRADRTWPVLRAVGKRRYSPTLVAPACAGARAHRSARHSPRGSVRDAPTSRRRPGARSPCRSARSSRSAPRRCWC